MKNLLFLCLLVLSIPRIKAQGLPPDYMVPELSVRPNTLVSNIQPPQPWSFTKYGGMSPNLYTGTVNAHIPIYTYVDPDFNIPISLSYASNGYIPNIQAGPVGLGWCLNAGGYITREVRLLPDEKDANEGYGYDPGYNLFGFYKYYQLATPDTAPESIFDRGSNLNSNYYYYNIGKVQTETVPDEFTFNFLGHSGKFSLDVGRINVYHTNHPQGEYHVEVDMAGSAPSKTITITITTGDGYKYTFIPDTGYEYQSNIDNYMNIEFTYLNFNPKPTVKTWLLSSIESPNKKTVSFEYTDKYFFETATPMGSIRYVGDEYSTGPGILGGSSSLYEHSTDLYWYGSKRQTRLLKSISIGSTIIDFGYSERKYPERLHVNKVKWSPMVNTPKLDFITIKNDGDIIKQYDLTYGYFGEEAVNGGLSSVSKANLILYLKGVNVIGEGKYTMEYYNEKEIFPFHGTLFIDHWGYYNGPKPVFDEFPSVYDFIPNVNLDDNYAETVTDLFRYPVPNYAKMGMLRTLSYPTGGCTKYYYEGHNYQHVVTRDLTFMNNPYLKALSPALLPAGGLRIKRISDFSTPQDSVSREYQYNNIYGANSAILLHMPRYKTIVEWFYSSGSITDRYIYVITSANDLFAYNAQGTHIEYSDVREVYDDGRYTHYTFSNYRTDPDIFYIGYRVFSLNEHKIYTFPRFAENFYTEPLSMAHERGRLLAEESGLALKKYYLKEYHYDKSRVRKYYSYVNQGIAFDHERKVYTDEDPLRKIVRTDYTYPYNMVFQRNTVSETEYRYNANDQLCSTLSTNSDGVITIDSVRYVYDIPKQELSEAEQKLIDMNIVNSPIYKYTFRRSGGERKFISARKLNYALFNNFPYVNEDQYAMLQYPQLSEFLTYTCAVTYTRYDNSGRLLEMKNRDGILTSYIWGYGGLYPVAEIVNVGIDAILQIKGLSSILTDPLQSGLSDDQDVLLRNIPNSQVTTYEYRPLYGISKIMTPDGRYSKYYYTDSGHLMSVVDENGKTLISYQYGLATPKE